MICEHPDCTGSHTNVKGKRPCPVVLAKKKQWTGLWRSKNRDKINKYSREYKRGAGLAYVRKYAERNRAKANEYSKGHYLRNKDRYRQTETRNRLLRRYGLTEERYKQLMDSNAGLCWTCNSRKSTSIDHCHKTGKIRGALCRQCNSALGFVSDNPATLRTLAHYIENGGFASCQ